MVVASIETTLELWTSKLLDVKRRMRWLFAQERSAVNAELFLDGLLGDERPKTGWMRAEAAGYWSQVWSARQLTCPPISLHSKVESLVAVTPIVTVFLGLVKRRFSVPACKLIAGARSLGQGWP